MNKIILLSIFLLTIEKSNCQKNKITQDSIIKKWENAVMNVVSSHERYTYFQTGQLAQQFLKKQPSYTILDSIGFVQSLKSIHDTISGAAIYLADGDRRYLITAKHVVFDKNWTYRHQLMTLDVSFHTSEYFEKLNSFISIKTPYDLFLKGKYNSFVVPVVDQDSSSRPFKFSKDDLDIAIISLQHVKTDIIRKTLDEDGYIPIKITDIDTSNNLYDGKDILAVGYPGYSLLGKFNENGFYSDIVLPLVTFGRIAMSHPLLSYFIADMTVYPGNSGGPVIQNNKLIGIVQSQMPVQLIADEYYSEPATHMVSRGALALIIKSKFIIPLLKQLQKNENNPAFLFKK